MQMASLFTSIQQVETRCRKEEETIEEYNRHKALANLTRARFMKQMENFTKQLKNDTPLTHNYSIPKSTNQTVLTNTLAQKIPNNILIPDIEANVQKQLERLKISNSLLTTTKNPTGTSSSSTRKTAQEEKSTTLQITGKLNELQLENPTQKSKVEIRQVSTPQNQDTRNAQRTVVNSTKQEEDNPNQLSQPKHIYADVPQKKKTEMSQEQKNNKKTPEEKKKEYLKKQDNEDTQEENDFISSDDDYSESINKKRRRQKPKHLCKLTHKQHVKAYPWAEKDSDNEFRRTNLSDEVEYIRHPNVQSILTDDMKKKLINKVKLPKEVIQEIDRNIKQTTNNFMCKLCSNSFHKRYAAQRHTKIEMGYHEYRCSFCNYLSNTTTCIYHHYVGRHGIPREWITSENLSNFVVNMSDTD